MQPERLHAERVVFLDGCETRPARATPRPAALLPGVLARAFLTLPSSLALANSRRPQPSPAHVAVYASMAKSEPEVAPLLAPEMEHRLTARRYRKRTREAKRWPGRHSAAQRRLPFIAV